jgi:flagellar biosynthesis/type III secretory pathway protein FliH
MKIDASNIEASALGHARRKRLTEGHTEGLTAGREEGRTEGREEGREDVARNA